MATIAERLLAGEHLGCSTWVEVAAKLGCDERPLRGVRALLRAQGWKDELSPRYANAERPLDNGAVSRCESASRGDADSGVKTATAVPDWAGDSLAAFDADNLSPVVPHRHAIKGVSTLLDADGAIKGQWVKTTAVNDERAEWLEAIRSIADTLPRYAPAPAPSYIDEDLLAVFPVGDPHIGQMSWWKDAGTNFDLKIAERNLVGAFGHLINLAPAASVALLVFIGDNTHADGQANTTTKGTRVDVDGRTIKMASTAISVGRQAVDLALAKFGRVHLIWERGNHDELIAAMTALAFSLIYENDPRVTVDTSPEMFHWFRFGANLIGTHHGDKVKPMDLLGVMAVDRADDWSATTHRRFYCGHFHHQMVKEVPGMIVEYLPTLAASDAWHRSMGYRSGRAMYMDVLHREHGHVLRHIVGVNQLEAA